MTKSILTSSITLGLALSIGLFATTACGGSDPGTGPSENSTSSTGGASSSPIAGNSGGAAPGASTGGASTGGNGVTGPGSRCEAGSGVQGGGADTCPNLAWRCADESLGNPPVQLVGAWSRI